MDTPNASPAAADDLSALAWVQDEVRRSLDAAHKALNRCLKEAATTGFSDMDALDPAVLRSARQHIHQGVGALELAGLPAGAMLLRASEALVQRYMGRPLAISEEGVRAIESASFALLDLIRLRLAGKTVSVMALFPQYETLSHMVGHELARPSDLWVQEWPAVSLEVPMAPPSDAQARPVDEAALAEFETALLRLLRGGHPSHAQALVRLCGDMAADATARQAHRESATWVLACGFLEALAGQRLPMSVHVKRVLSALLSQLRVLAKGQGLPSDRLAHELLFFCAQAGAPAADELPAPSSVLGRLREAFRLETHQPVDLTRPSLGRVDPAWVSQAAKRVAAAKEGWSSVAGGELQRLSGLGEQFSLVADSLSRLYPDGELLASALRHAADHTMASNEAPEASLAMEVATSLLYVEASLEEGEFDHPPERERIARMAERMAAVQSGQPAEPLEPWMEALYRRVSDRNTLGSVVQELRSTLGACEKSIDQFFREHEQPLLLRDTPTQLQSIKGVLAVLGLDAAAHAVARMRSDVDELLLPGTDLEEAAHAGVHDRLATNLGAVGFLVDLLAVQPALAKSLFVFNEDTGILAPIMGRRAPASGAEVDPIEVMVRPAEQVERVRTQEVAETLAESVARDDVDMATLSDELAHLASTPLVLEQPELAANVASAQEALARAASTDEGAAQSQARDDVVAALNQLAHTVSEPVGFAPTDAMPLAALAPQEPLLPGKAPTTVATGLEQDDEMREVFLEEAREVIEDARTSLETLGRQADDLGALTTLRRAFHTLKGSARMVGLSEFGEAAWAFEQLYNAWLASQAPANADLLGLTGDALAHLGAWVEAVAIHADDGRSAEPLVAAADALRERGQRLVLGEPLPAQPTPPSSSDSAARLADTPGIPPLPVLEPITLDLTDAEGEPSVFSDTHPSGFFDTHPPEFSDTHPSAPAELPPLDLLEIDATAPVHSADMGISAASPALPIDGTLSSDALADDALADDALGSVVLNLGEPDGHADPATGGALEGVDDLPRWNAEDMDALVAALDPGEPEAQATPPALAEGAISEVGSEPADSMVDEATIEPADQPADEQVKVIGSLRIGIPLFNIYLNEADEQSRRLCVLLSEWALETHQPMSDEAVALAHSLAGNSGAVGYVDLSGLARLLEHALSRAQRLGVGDAATASLFNDAADEIRRLLHQFAAGFLKAPHEELLARLSAFETSLPQAAPATPTTSDQPGRAHLRLVHTSDLAADDTLADNAPDMAAQGTDAPLEVQAEAPREVQAEVQPEVLAEALADAPDDAALNMPIDGALPAPHAGMPGLGLPELRPLAPLPDLPQRTAALPDELIDLGIDADIDAVDAVDADLFPIFEEEALELLPQFSADLRQWVAEPTRSDGAVACMRSLHTFKGGARLAGAMRLGELAHRLEGAIEQLSAVGEANASALEPVVARADVMLEVFDALRRRDLSQSLLPPAASDAPLLNLGDAAGQAAEPQDAGLAPIAFGQIDAGQPAALVDDLDTDAAHIAAGAAPDAGATALAPPIDWSRLGRQFVRTPQAQAADVVAGVGVSAVRVKPRLLDRLVNHAGEVSISRTRLSSQVQQMHESVVDLTDNLERLRQQLRDIELQAETQLSTRLEAARASQQDFDPLEFDRYTRFQELTRMMAESVNDVGTVQRGLIRHLESAEDQLAAQSRLTRDMQEDLLRTRMVEFEGLADRFYRVVRQAAKETGKQVRLDIVGGQTEVDRGVLERMTGAFEHLLRNCVTHGIELPADRQAQGKDPMGAIVITVRQEGNEVSLTFQDDGAGLSLARIRAKAEAMGLLAPGAWASDEALSQLIFTPGFSTAEAVTELAGRGIGMDVVRADVNAMGGRIETATAPGQGTSFKLMLPLTTAVTKVVMVRCGDLVASIPTNLVELVRRVRLDEMTQAYEQGSAMVGNESVPFFWLGALVQHSPRGAMEGRSLPLIIVRSAQQRVALHVDEVLGNQDVVVKNLGPQLSRVPGLAGMTLLASGAVSLIYNPVALATFYGAEAQAWGRESPLGQPVQPSPLSDQAVAPLVLVVDDSLTVRRVTQRLLTREGYRVTLAKDGLEALEKLAAETPLVVLSDIEMPRMDGFDLVRNLRGDERWRQIPIVMITSRIAQKHRDYAMELGVDHYLGKPYSEDELLSLVARYAGAAQQPALIP